jgi:hypothetical protein
MNDNQPIVIYNTEKKEVIGVFSIPIKAIKYLFEDAVITEKNKSIFNYALKSKIKINETRFSFPVAARYANSVQAEMLGDKDFFILDGYPSPRLTKINGFQA